MKEVKFFSFFLVALLALMYGLFFSGNLAIVPGLGFIFLSMAVILSWVSYRLYSRTDLQGGVYTDVRWMFYLMTIFFVVDLFPHVILPMFLPNQAFITQSHFFSHLFLFMASIFAGRFAIGFFQPNLKPAITIVVVIVGASALITSLIQPDTIYFIPVSKYPLIHSSDTYGWLNLITNLVSFGFAGLYFIVKGFASSNSFIRNRALLFGFGMVVTPLLGFLIHFPKYLPDFVLINLLPILYTGFVIWGGLSGLGALYGFNTPAESQEKSL